MKGAARLVVVGMVTAAHAGLVAALWRSLPAAPPPAPSVTVDLVEPEQPPRAPATLPVVRKTRPMASRAPQPKAAAARPRTPAAASQAAVARTPVAPPQGTLADVVPESATSALVAPTAASSPQMRESAPLAPVGLPVLPAEPEPVTLPDFRAAYLNNPPPPYPALSRRYGEQGRVSLRVYVDPSGQVSDIEVRQSSGHARLDRAARDAVRQWHFVPARRGDVPIAAWVVVPISFVL